MKKAKNKAVFSYQFGYQLAMETAQKLRYFSPVHSVRERVIARIEQGARNVDILFREVAKPGIAPGSGPGDRGFESRLPDHSQMPFGRSDSQVEHGSKELPRAWRPREIHRNRPVVGVDCDGEAQEQAAISLGMHGECDF